MLSFGPRPGEKLRVGPNETCYLSGSLLNHGKFSERSLSSSNHPFGALG
jgi:hypothetical protein